MKEKENYQLSEIESEKIIEQTDTELTKKTEKKYAYHGIFYGMLSALFLGLSNTLIKKTETTSGSEQALMRYIVQFILMLTGIILTKSHPLGPKGSRHLLMVRGTMGCGGMIGLHFAIKLINPSDAVALLHLNTMIVTILARIFLKELLSIAHLTCLILSFIGVVFIAQPMFLFNQQFSSFNLSSVNLTHNIGKDFDIDPYASVSNLEFAIGISLAILAAVLSSITAVALKKLSNNKVHYSVTTMYACYFGLPTSTIMSVVMLATGITKKDPHMLDDIPSFALQLFYSFSSGLCGTLSQVLINVSLKYEDASRVSIYRSTDLFFTYIFQYFWLNISTNFYSGIGAFLIIFGTILILVYKIFDKRLAKKALINGVSSSCWKKVFMFKF